MGNYENEVTSNLERADTNLQVARECWIKGIMMYLLRAPTMLHFTRRVLFY